MTRTFDPYNFEQYREAADYIKSRIDVAPTVAIILGSALGGLADAIDEPVVIPYKDVPNMLRATNPAHKGEFVIGKLDGKPIAALSGRFHGYEGYDYPELAQPVRILHLLGIESLIVTNAAGGVNPTYNVGDLMLISDQIKLTGVSPLFGPNLDEFGDRFPDMSEIYTEKYRVIAKEVAAELGITDILREGVYSYMTGPQYETPAEIRAISILGGDAVGMSTVMEGIVARHCGMKVLGISLISNKAAGLTKENLSDMEVIEAGKISGEKFTALVREFIKRI